MKRIYSLGLSLMFLSLINIDNLHATDYYLKTGAGAITTASSWNTAPNGSGSNAASFAGSGNVWHFTNRASGSLLALFGAPSGATVVIESGFNLSVSGLNGQISSLIDVASGGTLTIGNSKTYPFNLVDAASTVVITQHPPLWCRLAVVMATSPLLLQPMYLVQAGVSM